VNKSVPKTPAKKIWILFSGALLFLLAWSGYWLFGAHLLQEKAIEKIANLQAQGYQIEMQDMRVRGWPYRFALTMEDVQITPPPEIAKGRFFVPVFRVHAMAWKLSHLIVEVPEDSRFRSESDQEWLYRSERSRASLVFAGGQLSRLSLEMVKPSVVGSGEAPAYASDLIELHIRPGSDPDSREVFAFATSPVWPQMPIKPLQELRLQAEVFGATTLLAGEDLEQFRAASGHVIVDEFLLQANDASALVSGTMQIDANGYANGPLTLKLTEPGQLLSQVDLNQLDSDGQKALATISMLTGGVKETSLSFRLKKGGIYSGPFRIARTGKLIE
jgi:hypothetical protein